VEEEFRAFREEMREEHFGITKRRQRMSPIFSSSSLVVFLVLLPMYNNTSIAFVSQRHLQNSSLIKGFSPMFWSKAKIAEIRVKLFIFQGWRAIRRKDPSEATKEASRHDSP
jgi:hypothetical protein